MVDIRYLDDRFLTNAAMYELHTYMMNKLLCALAASASIASPALADDKPYYGELRERLESPVIATVESTKQPYDLEACSANAVLSLGGPVVLRDGPDNVIVGASMEPNGQAFLVSINLIKTATGTRMELRLRGKGWDERMKERMTVCATSPNRF